MTQAAATTSVEVAPVPVGVEKAKYVVPGCTAEPVAGMVPSSWVAVFPGREGTVAILAGPCEERHLEAVALESCQGKPNVAGGLGKAFQDRADHKTVLLSSLVSE